MKTRGQRLTLALVIAFAIAGLVAVTHQSSLARRSADFTIDYTAALLIRQGHPDAIYDQHRLGPMMLKLSNRAIDPRLPFDAPLAMALPYVPLTFMPLEVAFHAWQAITLALLALAVFLLARWIPLDRRAAALGLVVLLGFPATWALLSEGQSSAMLLLGAVLLIHAWRSGSGTSAFAGGVLLAFKPQYVPVYVICLLAARHGRATGAAVVGGIIVGLSPLIAGGISGFGAMVWSALNSGQGVIRYNESLIGTLAPFLPGSFPTDVGFALWGVVLVVLMWLALWRPYPTLSRTESIAMAVLATAAGMIFAPHALPYDLVLLAVPMWLAFDLARRGGIPTPAPAGFAIAAAMVLDLGRPIVSLTPVAMLVCLGAYGYAWFRRRAETDASQAA